MASFARSSFGSASSAGLVLVLTAFGCSSPLAGTDAGRDAVSNADILCEGAALQCQTPIDAAPVDSSPTDVGSEAPDALSVDVGSEPPEDASCDSDHDGVRSPACGGGDCDDSDRYRYPGLLEQCEGTLPDGRPAQDHDEDCNPCTIARLRSDGDQDNDLAVVSTCSNPWLGDSSPVGCDLNAVRVLGASDSPPRTVRGADCNDDPTMDGANAHPNQVEACNERDDNCNGTTDEGILIPTFYPDGDHDGFGDSRGVAMMRCVAPVGYVDSHNDCGDANASVYPGATERCDGADNDCNGTVDDLPRMSCTVGSGACARTGNVTCTGCTATSDTPIPVYQPYPAPNGSWDWNCDGRVDQQYTAIEGILTSPAVICGGYSMAACAATHYFSSTGSVPACGASVIRLQCTWGSTACNGTTYVSNPAQGCM